MADFNQTQSVALPFNKSLLGGVLSGWIGGAVFGMMMGMMGMLPMIGKIVGAPSAVVGFIVHMVISAILGVGFAVVFGRVAQRPSTSWLWGLLYGSIWWILGPLTMMPLMMGMGLQWSAAAAAKAMHSLMGHLIYGGLAGLSFAYITRKI
ncbi:hypothetical protein IIA15_09330 [candidate division TA06 bacterium]|nr:hypothetical protein [candidate division TA06 bacterium]